MNDDFHLPHSFDDDPRPFKRGELKSFKEKLRKHADDKGYTEEARRQSRAEIGRLIRGNKQRTEHRGPRTEK